MALSQDRERHGGRARALAQLDWVAIRRGAGAYLAVAVPCTLLISLVHGHDPVGQESNLWIVAAVAIIVVAPLVGGAVAGAAQPRAPLSHGAAAVCIPAGVFLLVRIGAWLVEGSLTAPRVVTLLLFLMIFTGLGLAGGHLGFWWHRRSRTSG